MELRNKRRKTVVDANAQSKNGQSVANDEASSDQLRSGSSNTLSSVSGLLSSIRTTPRIQHVTRGWSDPTILDVEVSTTADLDDMLAIRTFFSVPRSEDELSGFLEGVCERFPPECGWIHDMIPQFQKIRNEDATLLLLHCPLLDLKLMDTGSCFTNDFVKGLVTYLEYKGVNCIMTDIRKQCRRNLSLTHCSTFSTAREQVRLMYATAIEVLIARNVFGITLHSTLAFSVTTCDALALNPNPFDFGTIHEVRWHPGHLASLCIQGSSATRQDAIMLFQTELVTVLQDIVKGNDAFSFLSNWYQKAERRTLSGLFRPFHSDSASTRAHLTLPRSTSSHALSAVSSSMLPLSYTSPHSLTTTLSSAGSAGLESLSSTSSHVLSPVSLSIVPRGYPSSRQQFTQMFGSMSLSSTSSHALSSAVSSFASFQVAARQAVEQFLTSVDFSLWHDNPDEILKPMRQLVVYLREQGHEPTMKQVLGERMSLLGPISLEEILRAQDADRKMYNQRDDVKARVREYRQRDDVKARQREYYQRDDVKARVREYKQRYKQRDDVKAKQREYDQREDVKAKQRKRQQGEDVKAKRREYYQREDVKAKRKEYSNRPEVKARRREYYQREDVKARGKEYRERPEVKARNREYKQREDVKAKEREYRQRPEVKARRHEREYRQREDDGAKKKV